MVEKPTKKTAESVAADKEAEAAEAIAAAVEEATAPEDGVLSFEFRDETFTFKRKRIDAMQFRLPMQKGHDAEATEWLLGDLQYRRFLSLTMDEDGCTSLEDYFDLLTQVGKAVGGPNS